MNISSLRNLARSSWSQGDRNIALNHWQQACADAPSDVGIHIEYADRLREAGEHAESDRVYRLAGSIGGDHPAIFRGLGLNARTRGRNLDALLCFRVAWELLGPELSLALDCAHELRALGRRDEAELICNRLLGDHQDSWALQRALGFNARDRGNTQQALDHFRRAHELAPERWFLQLDCAHELRILGQLAESDAAYAAVLERDPDNPAARAGLGLNHRERGSHDLALEEFNVARRLDPNNTQLVLDSAHEMRALGRIREAESLCAPLAADPNPPPAVLRALGFNARHRGNFALALDLFEKAVARDPNNVGLMLDCANELRSLGWFDAATRQANAILDSHPHDVAAMRSLGYTARAQERHEHALNWFQSARENGDDTPQIKFECARELVKLRRLDEAQALLDLLPEDQAAQRLRLRGLADLHEANGDIETELELLQQLVSVAPWSLDSYLALTRRALATRCVDIAVNALTAAESKLGDVSDLQFERIALSRVTGDAAAAKAGLEDLHRAASGQNGLLVRLSQEARLQDLYVHALAYAREALSVASDDPRAVLAAVRALRALGRPREALATFQPSMVEASTELLIEKLSLLIELDDFESAWEIAELRQFNPDAPFRLFSLLVQIYAEKGDVDGARGLIEFYAPAIVSASEMALLEADLSFYRGDGPSALAWLDQVKEGDPLEIEALNRRATILNAVEDYPAANGAMERLVRLKPALRPGLNLVIARNLFFSGRYDEAVSRLTDQHEEWGDSPALASIHAFILARRGAVEDAISRLSVARKQFPESSLLWGDLVRLLAVNGRWSEVDQLLASFDHNSNGQTCQWLTTRAFVAVERRDYHSGVDLLEQSIAGRAANGEECRLLALANLSIRNLERAKLYLGFGAKGERRTRRIARKSLNVSQSLHGQLIDEYRLDAANLARLGVSPNGSPTAEMALEMLNSAAAEPQSTLLAVSALIALRQSRLLTSEPISAGQTLIPKHIVQFWDTQPPGDLEPFVASWRTSHPDWTYRLFDAESARTYLRTHYNKDVASAFDQAREPAVKADLFRLAFLFREGGLYADCDDLCLMRFDDLLGGGASFVGYQEDIGSVANNILCAIKGHPIIEHALWMGVLAIQRGDADMPWLCTGPALLSRSFISYLGGTTFPASSTGIRLLERHEMARYAASHCYSSYKATASHWTRKLFR